MILPLVLVLFLFLLILVGAQFFVVREQRATLFRFRLTEHARRIMSVALDEAFVWLGRESAEPGGKAFPWFVEGSRQPLSIPLPATGEFLTDLLPRPLEGKVLATARLVSSRVVSEAGEPFRCSPRACDAIGVFECAVDLELRDSHESGKKPLLALTGVRHHEYKVVSLVSPRDNQMPRNAYSHCFALDHALLVRFGVDEFRRSQSRSLHVPGFDLVVDQADLPPERRGKIFFGGTDPRKSSTAAPGDTPRENVVFLNIPDALASQVVFWERTLPARQDEVLHLFPELEGILASLVTQHGLQKADWIDMTGNFRAGTAPLPHASGTASRLALEARTAGLLCQGLSGADAHQPIIQGLSLAGDNASTACDPAFVDSIMEGAIRKRFLYQVVFQPDFSGARIKGTRNIPGGVLNETLPVPDFLTDPDGEYSREFPCVPIPHAPGAVSGRFATFLERLPAVVEKHPEFPLFSRFETSFRYGGRDGDLAHPPASDAFPLPRFFDTQGREIEAESGGFRPFAFHSLWLRDGVSPGELRDLDLYQPEAGIIRPRGLTRISGVVDLGEPDGNPLSIQGRGVIAADGFRLRSGLRKNGPDDLLVLLAEHGSIEICTDAPIEAVLIAIDTDGKRTGTVRARKPLNLHGALICDTLSPSTWVPATHRLRYDPSLKQPATFTYAVAVSELVRFSRVAER